MYFARYAVFPGKASKHFGSVGGAIVNCLIAVRSAESAHEAAMANFESEGWEVECVEVQPRPVAREDYQDSAEWLGWFDEALEHGECYVYHQWPPEAQEGDAVH